MLFACFGDAYVNDVVSFGEKEGDEDDDGRKEAVFCGVFGLPSMLLFFLPPIGILPGKIEFDALRIIDQNA